MEDLIGNVNIIEGEVVKEEKGEEEIEKEKLGLKIKKEKREKINKGKKVWYEVRKEKKRI